MKQRHTNTFLDVLKTGYENKELDQFWFGPRVAYISDFRWPLAKNKAVEYKVDCKINPNAVRTKKIS
ncbi:hypothetical protein, partial [Lactiplantibacillus fabifermentans]|uniref:hypothetical protein n=1 Tax=Lactiplantibacillus fabifermentans TaxID=483011 RepID=UPI001F219266